MVKVIENGKDRVFEVVCDSCGSKLEYMYKDTHGDNDDDDYNDCDFYRYITCPVCREEVQANFEGVKHEKE